MEHFQDIQEGIKSYYSEKIIAHGDTPQGVDWKDAASQLLRFDVLADLFRSRSFSILDVGCGTGTLLQHLRQCGYTITRYLGIDICEEMIASARTKVERGSNADFRMAELSDITERFDYVVSSGIYNVKQDIDAREWKQYVLAMVKAQHSACTIGTAFNVLTSYVDFTVPHLYYCDPKMLFDFCKRNLSRFVSLRHDYPLYEFTTFVYRDESV